MRKLGTCFRQSTLYQALNQPYFVDIRLRIRWRTESQGDLSFGHSGIYERG